MAATDSTLQKTDNFFVSATSNLGDWDGWEVTAGDDVLIDPFEKPKDGDIVLIGNNLEFYTGQNNINGTAVYIGRVKNRFAQIGAIADEAETIDSLKRRLGKS